MAEAETKTTAKRTTAADKRTIVQRMLAIADDVGVLEPSKSGGVPFAFRGIDATVAHLAPLLNKHGVIVVPQLVSHELTCRDVGNKVVTKASIEANYRFYGAEGDFLDVTVPGQADDFADRSTAQAMSVAFRIALLQAFHIPAFGNEEAHSEDQKNTREAAAAAKVNQAAAASAPNAAQAKAADEMRKAIIAEGARQGKSTEDLNALATELGLVGDWIDDPASLNKILVTLTQK